MNRITGSTTISLNVDVLASGPWDARSIIPYFSGLTDNQTLPYPYAGMVVTVYNDDDITKNGVYYCSNKGGNIEFADGSSVWVKIGSGEGTLTGGTIVNNRISGATSSGYTQYWGEVDAATGGTYSDGTITLSGSGNLSTITGFNVLSGSGISALTFNESNSVLTLTSNNNIPYTANLGILAGDLRVTGGTYEPITGVGTFTNNSGNSFTVSGFLTGYTNFYTTGSSYNPNTGIITFNRTDTQPAYSATGFNYITGFTVTSNNSLSGVTNTGETINGGTINAVTGGTLIGDTLYLSGTGNFLSSITGFGTLQNAEFLTGGTISSNNIISGITNSGNSVNFGQVNAVTGGSFSNNILYLSGTGTILSGVSITGFSTSVGSLIYTGGTSTAGTGGTTNITGTLIESGQTTGVTFSLSGALSFTNSNVTKREVGGIGDGSNFFETGKTLQEIIQQIFYPIDAPTITNIGKTLTNSGSLSSALQIVGTTGSVILNPTYTSGASVTILGTKRTGPVTSFVFSGYTQPSTPVTAFTSNNTTAYTVNSSYSVVNGYNTWTCNINYGVGEQPVYDDGSPYYGANVNQFIQAGTVTPSNITIEGVYPVSATTTTGNLSFQQQTLVSMLSNTTLQITLPDENNASFKQSFILPQDLDNRFSKLELYNDTISNFQEVVILDLFSKVVYGTINIGGDIVTYYRYTYKIPDLTGESLYKLTFS